MYEQDQTTLTNALTASPSPLLTNEVINTILTLSTADGSGGSGGGLPGTGTLVQLDNITVPSSGIVTVAAGADVVFLAGSDTVQTTINTPLDAPVLIFQGLGGVNVVINDGATTVPAHAAGVVDRVIVGSAGNDNIVITDRENTQVHLGTGNSTVVAGQGFDTIVAGLGNSTISGGTGHTIVDLGGNASDYVVTVNNGHAVVTHNSDGNTTDITKIQFVQLDAGKALVFANDTQQAAVTSLYEATFGRTADAGGLDYWFDRAAAGASLSQIAAGFTQSSEFSATAALSNSDFVSGLYLHTFGRAAEADGLAYWTAALASGGATRAQLIASFADIASHNIDGTVHTEASVVGSVTIVHNIV